jgi:hypothetical protein
MPAEDSTADAITVISFFADRVRTTMNSVPTRVIMDGACNPFTPAVKRCARWVTRTHDRVGGTTITTDTWG